MSEQDLQNAAAAAAAAGVAEVQDQAAEAERQAAMETETVIASGAAEDAAVAATEAVEAANAAAEAAQAASAEADAASATAAAAAGEAYDARADVDNLRQSVAAGFGDLREFISSRLPERPEPSTEPTEVVVTHERPNTTAENGTDTGSNGGAGNDGTAATERPPRHRFGNRRRLSGRYPH